MRIARESEPQSVSVYAAVTERAGARIMYFDGKKSPGQVHLDWGKLAWSDAFDEQLASGSLDGRRWRFGRTSGPTSTRAETLELEFAMKSEPIAAHLRGIGGSDGG